MSDTGEGDEVAARARDEVVSVLLDSGLVDERWYKETYPDVANGGLDPVSHYVDYGAAEGRDPNSHFSTRWYLNNYPDVRETGINPLLHYLLHGAQEGRRVGPAFDTAYYLAHNTDVDGGQINPLVHYLRSGLRERRLGRPYPFGGGG